MLTAATLLIVVLACYTKASVSLLLCGESYEIGELMYPGRNSDVYQAYRLNAQSQRVGQVFAKGIVP